MKFSDTQILDFAAHLLDIGAEIVGARDGIRVHLPNGNTSDGPTLRDVLTELLAEDPGAERHPEPIDEIRALVPNAEGICIDNSVWAPPNEANSKVSIFIQNGPKDKGSLYSGKTFAEARADLARKLPRLSTYLPK